MKTIMKPDAALSRILPPQKPDPDAEYVRSQFTQPFVIEGRRVVCSTLTRQIAELEEPLAERYTAKEIEESADLTALMQGYFLVPEGKDECTFYENLSKILRALKKTGGIRGYTILPTLSCNARCVYCYEEGMRQVTMTPQTVEQTVEYILKTKAKGKIEIGWFGGEPLLGGAIIDRICERLLDSGVEFTSSMITNGSLITEAAADRMAGLWKIKSVQISMDGAEPDYILRKQYRDSHDHYHTVLRAVSLLTKRDIRVSIRCNVDEENFEGVPRFLSDLSAAIPEKEKVNVYLAPLNAVRMGKDDVSMWKKVIESEALIRQAGFQCTAFMKGGAQLRVHHCMADAGSVVITPDGSLFSCEHCPQEARFGDLRHGVTDEASREDFCRTDRTRDKCRTCLFLPECTSFAACPVQDTHCREVHFMQFENGLKRLLEAEKRQAGNRDPEEREAKRQEA